jgi:esterase/lipase
MKRFLMDPFVPEQGQLSGISTGTDPLYGLPDYESPTIQDKPRTLYHPSLPSVSERAEPNGSKNDKSIFDEDRVTEYNPSDSVTSAHKKIDKIGRDVEALQSKMIYMQGVQDAQKRMQDAQNRMQDAQNRTIRKLLSRRNRN